MGVWRKPPSSPDLPSATSEAAMLGGVAGRSPAELADYADEFLVVAAEWIETWRGQTAEQQGVEIHEAVRSTLEGYCRELRPYFKGPTLGQLDRLAGRSLDDELAATSPPEALTKEQALDALTAVVATVRRRLRQASPARRPVPARVSSRVPDPRKRRQAQRS